jgi:hypothetical protein
MLQIMQKNLEGAEMPMITCGSEPLGFITIGFSTTLLFHKSNNKD